jgi:hypothetical protein
MKKFFLTIVMCAAVIPSVSYAGDLDDARLSLKKWGLAHCLSEYLAGPIVEKDAGGALEAYFQKGAHGDEKAYENVRNFLASSMKTSKNFRKSDNSRLVIVGCLNIYESKPYRRLIKQQDKYLSL